MSALITEIEEEKSKPTAFNKSGSEQINITVNQDSRRHLI